MPFLRSLEYVKQGTVIRKDPLGHVRLNDLASNTEALMDPALAEHRSTGVHNALEVPFLVGRVEYPTVYGLSGSTWYSSVSNPATGRVVIAGTTALRIAIGGAVLVGVSGDQVASVPHLATWESGGGAGSEVPIRIRKLTSALGAGNSWADVTQPFDVAVHTVPTDADVSPLATPHAWQRRDFLSSDTALADPQWDTIASNQEILHGMMLAEHTSAGAHNTPRISKALAWVNTAAGPSYVLSRNQQINSVAYVSTGVCDVTLKNAMAAHSTFCFPQARPSSIGEFVVAHALAISSTVVRVYLYLYSGGNWSRADRGFFLPIYGVLA